jgi:hypothetical protein
LESVYGGSFRDTGFWDMVDHVPDSGDGARGIVAGQSRKLGEPGHVFNILNRQGRVLFVDIQTGFFDPVAFGAF